MAEYIDREELIRDLRPIIYKDGYIVNNTVSKIIYEIQCEPTADVIELRPILEEYEELVQTNPTSKAVDEFCIKTMRKILCDYYVKKI